VHRVNGRQYLSLFFPYTFFARDPSLCHYVHKRTYLFRGEKKGGEGCDWLVGLDCSRPQVATYLMRRANSKACCRLSRLNVIIIDGPLKYKCISRRHFRRWGPSTSSATNVKKYNVKPVPRNVMTDVTYCLL